MKHTPGEAIAASSRVVLKFKSFMSTPRNAHKIDITKKSDARTVNLIRVEPWRGTDNLLVLGLSLARERER